MYRSSFALFLLSALVCGAGCRTAGVPSGRADVGPHAFASKSAAAVRAPDESEAADPQGVLTLREAGAHALMHNADLKVFPFEMRVAEARSLQARLLPNPELSVEVEEFGGSDERSDFDAAETTIQLGQLIELAGKRERRTRVASLDRALVQWDYESARLDTMREVADAFVAVLAGQERLALTEQLRDLSAEAEAAVAQRVEAGKDSPVDLLRAKVAFSTSRIEMQKAEALLAAARHRLAATWGGHTAAFERAAGDLYEVLQPASLDDMATAIAENPDLARWETEEAKRRAALRLEKSRASPDVTVAGGVQRFEETDDTALIFGLAVPLPVFNRNQGGIEEATANLAKTRRQYEAAKVRMVAALAAAVHTLTAAYDEVGILRSDVLPQAQQALEAAQQGYREGKFDYLYVLDTQRTFFETKTRLIDSLEAYHRARADVERRIGRSLEAGPPHSAAAANETPTTQENKDEK